MPYDNNKNTTQSGAARPDPTRLEPTLPDDATRPPSGSSGKRKQNPYAAPQINVAIPASTPRTIDKHRSWFRFSTVMLALLLAVALLAVFVLAGLVTYKSSVPNGPLLRPSTAPAQPAPPNQLSTSPAAPPSDAPQDPAQP